MTTRRTVDILLRRVAYQRQAWVGVPQFLPAFGAGDSVRVRLHRVLGALVLLPSFFVVLFECFHNWPNHARTRRGVVVSIHTSFGPGR